MVIGKDRTGKSDFSEKNGELLDTLHCVALLEVRRGSIHL
jgi:hypothetical protein